MKPIRLAALVIMIMVFATTAFAAEIQRIDKDALKNDMGSFNIIDVRTGSDWKGSEFKIQGAVRLKGDIVDFVKSKGWAKDAKIILYCA